MNQKVFCTIITFLMMLINFNLLAFHNKVNLGDKKIISDTIIKILWQGKKLDSLSSKNSCCMTTQVNESYIRNLTAAERAALGLISTFIASDCNWDGQAGTPIYCRLTSLLGFGHQCSETQLNFLRHWFRYDTSTLKRLVFDSCSSTTPGANRQHSFTQITLQKTGNKIIIDYWAFGISLRRSTSWDWKETLVFSIGKNESIFLTKRYGKKLD